MFKNYINSAFRNILKNKFYSALNIIGLTVGLVSTIFILLYIRDELSFDKYNTNYKRIYRLESDFRIGEKHDKFAITSFPLAPALKLEYPEIESFTRMFRNENMLIRCNNKEFYENNIWFTDSTHFSIFSCKFIYGSPGKALCEPNTIVLTQKLAKKYFGSENPLGKLIYTNGNTSYKVSGVIENLPGNTHIQYDGLISMSTVAKFIGFERFNSMQPEAFWNVNPFSFILLKPNVQIETLLQKSPEFYKKYMETIGKQINANFKLMATGLGQIHLHSTLTADEPTGNIFYVYIFSFVAFFILLIAAINYMNMATAKSTNRAKEVGMRKVIGAYRVQIQRQFLFESVVLAFISLIISLFLIQSFLPMFNTLTDKQMSFGIISDPLISVGILLITLLVGLISGSYPAFYLSSFIPAVVLKEKNKVGRKNALLRKILVVFQFVISIFMISSTLIVSSQFRFFQNKNIGFDKENLLFTQIQDTTFAKSIPAFKQELLKNPDIIGVSTSFGLPYNNFSIQVMRVENGGKMQEIALNNIIADYDFIKIMGMQIVKGRDFDKTRGTDLQKAVIINETAAKKLGWIEPLGKKIQYDLNLDGTANRNTRVIGVVKDFNYISLHNQIEPMVIFLQQRPGGYLTIKIKEGTINKSLGYINGVWQKFGVKNPFDYKIMTDSYNTVYAHEKKLTQIFTVFSVISLFIALLGLLGLASFVTEQRTKEIGIRKISGASVASITGMFYYEFSLLLGIAFVIASPISYFFLSNWLEKFAYHVTVSPITFLLSGIIAWVVTMLAISFHTLKAATENPVKAIKYE
jgi:putative ABC transport system permease protein